MNTVQEAIPNTAFPPPCPFPDLQNQDRSEDSTHNNAASDPAASTSNQLPGRCQFFFSDGRQCRMARSEIHPSRCPFHAEREDQLFGDPSPAGYVVGAALDLPELYSACRDLTTAAGVNRALAQVFRLLAQRRISRQEAATFGHLAQLLLRTISAMRAEYDDPTRSGFRTPVESTGLPRPEIVVPSSDESHQQDELSSGNKVQREPRGLSVPTPVNKAVNPTTIAAGDRAPADGSLTPQREANAAPASCAQADDATSIVIPSDGPERGISPAPPVNIVTPLLAHNKVALSPLSSSRESRPSDQDGRPERRTGERDLSEAFAR
jgi:hypothetical protein